MGLPLIYFGTRVCSDYLSFSRYSLDSLLFSILKWSDVTKLFSWSAYGFPGGGPLITCTHVIRAESFAFHRASNRRLYP